MTGEAMIDGDGWRPPRCGHGHIILGCPHDDCPEQTAYLGQQHAAVDAVYERQRQDARRLVRSILGLDAEAPPC